MIKLMELPYNLDALEPYISRQTLGFHYLKHHKGYVEKLNKLIEGTQFETMTLEEIVTEAHKKTEYQDIYHNAAQVWNHNFYWQSLNPNGGEPNKKLLEKIEETFGSFDDFKDIMRKKALEQFGSGKKRVCPRIYQKTYRRRRSSKPDFYIAANILRSGV